MGAGGVSLGRWLRTLIGGVGLAALAACGGGGGGGGGGGPIGGGPADASGLYFGTSGSGGTLREIFVLVLDNGRFYTLYSSPAGGPAAAIGGLLVGNGSTTGNTFSAAAVRDFNFEGAGVGTGNVSATVTESVRIAGTAFGLPLRADYDNDYEQMPALATLADDYDGEAVVLQSNELLDATLTVGSGGALSGTLGLSCAITGTVGLHASGNVYDVNVVFGANCPFAQGSALAGHAYLYDGFLYVFLPNAARDQGLLFLVDPIAI